MKVSILSIYAAAVFFTVESNAKSEKLDKDEKSKEKSMAKLPPCSACSVLVKSFEKGLANTVRGKFEGGDTAWEEKNQGKGYSTSEVVSHLCHHYISYINLERNKVVRINH